MGIVITLRFQGVFEGDVEKANRKHQIAGDGEIIMKDILKYVSDNILSETDELKGLFAEGVVPSSILVLINDSDWELEGKEECVIESGDSITFLSRSHGG